MASLNSRTAPIPSRAWIYARAEDALQPKLRVFIADELRAWEKTFPDELWEEFGRLRQLGYPPAGAPEVVGKAGD